MKTKHALLAVFSFLVLGAFSPTKSSAQLTLTFCAYADNNYNFASCATTFAISDSGSYIKFIIWPKYGSMINTHAVKYVIYKDGVYNATIYHSGIDPTWAYAWKQINFYSSGYYTVDVYDMDQYDALLDEYGVFEGSAAVTIKFQSTL